MPPKPKFTKEEIIGAALDIIREKGVDALTARELGDKLGSSTRPIFTLFKSMEEVKSEMRNVAMQEFEKFSENFTDYTPAFKKMGVLMISFAIMEPKLFQLLFMQENNECKSFEENIENLGTMADTCVEVIMEDYGLSEKEAKVMFEQLWIHTYGLSTLCAMKVCTFSEKEISDNLSQVFAGMLMLIKSGKLDNCTTELVKNQINRKVIGR